MVHLRIIFIIITILLMNRCQSAHGAGLLSPYISIIEEYNDNLNLSQTNNTDDYITTVQPGVKFSNMEKTSGIDLDYSLGAVYYGKNTGLNYISHNGSLSAKYMTAEHFNFYLKESYIRSENNREQEYYTTAEDNRYVLATQTSRAIYWRNVLTPTVEYQFGPENRLGINYRNNLYRNEDPSSGNSQENYINPFLSYQFDKRNTVYIEYGYTKGVFDKNPDMTGHRAKGRFTNRFGAKTSVFAEYTFSKYTFASPGVDYDINEPSMGITHAFTPSVSSSVQIGYFHMNPATGSTQDGVSYKGELINLDRGAQTTYRLSFEGGYTEDYFTSQNLGFLKYHRLTGSLTHMLGKRMSIGGFGSVERADFHNPEHVDDIWGIGINASYMPLKWLTIALEGSRSERRSDIDLFQYTVNRGFLKITATY